MAQRPLINSENQSEELIRHTKMPVVPGKCFARCLIPDSFAFMNVVYLEYQGSYPDQAGIEIKEILILPARTEWIRREFVQGVDKGCCMGADPCLIWALEEIPAEIESFYHVVDTNSIKNYSRKIVTKSIKLKEGGYKSSNLHLSGFRGKMPCR